jgi:hypothetical protein
MKQLLFIFFMITFCFSLLAQQDLTPQEIKELMSQIREDTDWSDPVASKKANDEIKKLSKQLMMSRVNKNPTNQTDSVRADLQKENIENISKTWNQMMESAKLGEEGDMLLGKPVRDEIAEDYNEDQSPKNFNPEFLKQMNILVIDMSIPTVQRTIDVMHNFTGIEILIITAGKGNVSVDLSDILQKASHYPLKELYVINFGQLVSTIPEEVNQFKDLTTLGLFNNDLAKLPESGTFASNLSSLSIDINPIYTLFPDINSFKNLKTLSIAKTSISDSEVKAIKDLLPECEIITE